MRPQPAEPGCVSPVGPKVRFSGRFSSHAPLGETGCAPPGPTRPGSGGARAGRLAETFACPGYHIRGPAAPLRLRAFLRVATGASMTRTRFSRAAVLLGSLALAAVALGDV